MSENRQINESLKLKCEIEIGRFAYVISIARESRNKYERVTRDCSNNSPLILIKITKELTCRVLFVLGLIFLFYLKLININYIIYRDVCSNIYNIILYGRFKYILTVHIYNNLIYNNKMRNDLAKVNII